MKATIGGVADCKILFLALINLLNAHPHMDLRHVSILPISRGLCALTSTQVSSRELAGKKLQGYDKREITYEVHIVYLAKLFVTDIHKNLSHEDVRKVCVSGALACMSL